MLLPRVVRYDPYTKTRVVDGEPEKEETIIPDVESVLVEEPKKTKKKTKKETKDENA